MIAYHRKGEKSTAESKARAAWVKANTTRIALKLQNSTDSDLINYLSKVPSKQGAIKQALREHIAKSTSKGDA